MNEIAIAKAKPNQAVIRCLEAALERARNGELQGVLVLMSMDGAMFHDDDGGRLDMGRIMLGFERWKFKRMSEMVLERSRGDDPSTG